MKPLRSFYLRCARCLLLWSPLLVEPKSEPTEYAYNNTAVVSGRRAGPSGPSEERSILVMNQSFQRGRDGKKSCTRARTVKESAKMNATCAGLLISRSEEEMADKDFSSRRIIYLDC